MKKHIKAVCRLICAAVWAVLACISFSEGKDGFALLQAVLSAGFISKAAAGYSADKNAADKAEQ